MSHTKEHAFTLCLSCTLERNADPEFTGDPIFRLECGDTAQAHHAENPSHLIVVVSTFWKPEVPA